ncbi:uncharacterized protein LOC118477796, partial [Aplysia californica]|uniref:Uncharacterized protein LOC118477796 n=1 Tax=Aplysia californica TaxID=6500 RepID=A0ABM1VUB8_APLCA
MAVRSGLEESDSRIVGRYSDLQCARLTFALAYRESLEVTLAAHAETFGSEYNRARAEATNALVDIQSAVTSFRGVDQQTRNRILDELAGFSFVQEPTAAENGAQHPAEVLPPVRESSLLRVSLALLSLNTAREEVKAVSGTGRNTTAPSALTFDLSINAVDGTIALPIGQTHLITYVQDADLLIPFYKTMVYRGILRYIFDKYLSTSEFLSLASCF